MTARTPTPVAGQADTPRWGLADAVVGWLVAEVLAVLASGIILSATGYLDPIGQAVLDVVGRAHGVKLAARVTPLWLVAVLQVFLWFGLLGAPLYATRRKGQGVVRDLGLRFAPTDVPLGIAIGLVSQFVLVPLVSLPWIALLGRDTSDLETPARALADKATDPVGVVLLALIVAIGAPLIEELFFRGLLMRAIERLLGTAAAVVLSAVAFGITHFELLQFPALAAFGAVLAVLTARAERLGPAIFAHFAFNASTVVLLLVRG